MAGELLSQLKVVPELQAAGEPNTNGNTVAASLDTDLDKLAAQLINRALSDAASFAEKLDIFKIVSQHRINLSKLNKKKTDDEADGSDFDSIKRRIAAAKEE